MILSTHIVEDVADLCPRMAIIVGGRIVRAGAPRELIARAARPHLAARRSTSASSRRIARATQVIATRLFGGRTVIHVLADANPGAGFYAGRGRSRGRLLLDARRRVRRAA